MNAVPAAPDAPPTPAIHQLIFRALVKSRLIECGASEAMAEHLLNRGVAWRYVPNTAGKKDHVDSAVAAKDQPAHAIDVDQR
jgi:hypothetical protein